MVTIYDKAGAVLLEVTEDDASFLQRGIMRPASLSLKFAWVAYVPFQVGAYIVFNGERYELATPPTVKKNGERRFEYTLEMVGDDAKLSLFKMRNVVDGRLKWSMCAKPHEFVEAIVANLNERDTGWTVGDCTESTEKTIEFNHTNLADALSSVASTFDTEWEISGKVVHLRKAEYYREDPLPLAYGMGNGLLPGIGRSSTMDDTPIKRLYVQGGERNIDRHAYGSPELKLPLSASLEVDGKTYTTDTTGSYIQRSDIDADATREDSLDLSEIYPSRVGAVSSVYEVDPAKNFYDFADDSIPEGLDYSACVIQGEKPFIRFQTGMLSGEKDFEFTYEHEARRFKLVPQDIDGHTMPNATFKPQAGDTYAVFGISLPQSYICDNQSQSGASWDMFREAAKYMSEHEEQRYSVTATVQALWARRNWAVAGPRLHPGCCVRLSDQVLEGADAVLRIVGVKTYLTDPHAPVIELSNEVTRGSLASKLKQIDRQEVTIGQALEEAKRYARRGFREVMETREMIENLDIEFPEFDKSINPITLQTMHMFLGNEQLQFAFYEYGTTNETTPNIVFTGNEIRITNRLSLVHFTLGQIGAGDITSRENNTTMNYQWDMPESFAAPLPVASQAYYLYAKCMYGSHSNATYALSTSPLPLQTNHEGYSFLHDYNLLIGIVNSEDANGERSFIPMYGFTEITPGRITASRIISASGNNWINLVNGQMCLGSEQSPALYFDGYTLTVKCVIADGAEIGGWTLSNGVLTSSSGSVRLDANTGNSRYNGVMQFSTQYGTLGGLHEEQANVTTLTERGMVGTDGVQHVVLDVGEDQIGKVLKIYNPSQVDGGRGRCYAYTLQEFAVNLDGTTEVVQRAEADTPKIHVKPGEVVELTCFEMPPQDGEKIRGRWYVSSRFSQEDFRITRYGGRFPRCLCMGTVWKDDEGPSISMDGEWFDGRDINEVASGLYVGVGKYRIQFHMAVQAFYVFANGIDQYGTIKACVVNPNEYGFEIDLSDDETFNEGSANFAIFDRRWYMMDGTGDM